MIDATTKVPSERDALVQQLLGECGVSEIRFHSSGKDGIEVSAIFSRTAPTMTEAMRLLVAALADGPGGEG